MLVGALGLLVLAVMVFALFVWAVQRSMLFPGTLRSPEPRAGEE